MTTLQQTVEIPADHRLFIDVPKEIPAGTATFRLEWIKPPEKPQKDAAEGAVNPSLRGTVKITGDIIGPFFDEWENALDEGEGIW